MQVSIFGFVLGRPTALQLGRFDRLPDAVKERLLKVYGTPENAFRRGLRISRGIASVPVLLDGTKSTWCPHDYMGKDCG